MTLVTVGNSDNKRADVTPTTQYCGEHYDEKHAWKNILAEQEEYIEILTLENENKETNNIPHEIPGIPCIPETLIPKTQPPTPQEPKTAPLLQYTTCHPTPQRAI